MKKIKSKKTQEKPKQKEAPQEDVYTPEEIKKLDEIHDLTEHKFDDDEVYELMLKYKNNNEEILKELEEQLKERKRGEEFEWREVGKSNLNIFNNIFI